MCRVIRLIRKIEEVSKIKQSYLYIIVLFTFIYSIHFIIYMYILSEDADLTFLKNIGSAKIIIVTKKYA